MTIRLKLVRKKEEQTRKIADLLQSYNISPNPNYYPIGGSSLSSNPTTVTNDIGIQATKSLFEMWHLVR